MELSLLHMSTVQQAHDLLNNLGCYPVGADLMAAKAICLVMRVNGLLPQAANILKQEMLAKGGEVAVPAGALRLEAGRVDCIVMGTLTQYARLVDILGQQPFELPDLARRLRVFMQTCSSPSCSGVVCPWCGTSYRRPGRLRLSAVGGPRSCWPTQWLLRGICSNSDPTFSSLSVQTSPQCGTWPNDLSTLPAAPSQPGCRTAHP